MQALAHLFGAGRRSPRDEVGERAIEQWLRRGLKSQSAQSLREPLPEEWIEMIDRSAASRPQQPAGRARR
jgi:hypothetical protein